MAIHIDAEVCKGCGLCVYYCPKEVLRLSDRINVRGYAVAEVFQYENCIHCHLCEYGCPDLAIFVENPEKEKATHK
jgi:2-oxoglutarate ferredoxin oxidoreductase subunit delta